MDTARSDLEKHTLLKNREREPGEMVDGISDGGSSTSTLLDNMDSEGKLNKLDIEEAPEAASASAQVAIRSNRARLTFWMVVNTLATIGIVSKSSQGNGPGQRAASCQGWDTRPRSFHANVCAFVRSS